MSSKHTSPSTSAGETAGPSTPKKARTAPEGNKCPICLNEAEDLTLLKTCSHSFCFYCIMRWLSQRTNCPLCKVWITHLKHSLKSFQGQTYQDADGVEVNVREAMEQLEFQMLRKNKKTLDDERKLIRIAMVRLNVARTSNNCPTQFRESMGKLLLAMGKLYEDCVGMNRLALCSNLLFRFVVYYLDADRVNVTKTSMGVDVTPAYVTENFERLKTEMLPFLVRELRAVTGRAVFDASLCDLFLQAFADPAKHRRPLFSRLLAMGVDHPLTLFNSVKSFVGANQSLKLYDSNSRYIERICIGSGANEDDDDVLVVSPAAPVGPSVAHAAHFAQHRFANRSTAPIQLDDSSEEDDDDEMGVFVVDTPPSQSVLQISSGSEHAHPKTPNEVMVLDDSD